MEETAAMKTFLEVFEELAAKKPDHVVMVDQGGSRETTLREFLLLTGRVTAKIESCGFPEGSFLLIHMSRCMEYVAAYFGAIKAGMAVVPTVSDYPEDRIQYIKENCESPFTITDSFFDDITDYEPSKGKKRDPESIVCMNYTSGSTGRPKGVYYSMRCVSRSIERAQQLFEGLDQVVTAASASLAFAAMCHDCLAPMAKGGTVHLLSDEIRKDVKLMMQYYEEHQIRCGNVSPGMLRFFKHTPGLQRVLTTGERVINAYSDEHEIWCVYGLTEAYTAVSYFKIDKPYENTPIGKPFGGVVMEILDEDGHEVPDGEEGEIYVTWYLSEGYYKMPEETKKNFLDLGGGMHRFATHERAYRDENGDIVYVNRKDWMVKINGQRVEPFGIEAVISSLPYISNCVVKCFSEGNESPWLCAYYIEEEAAALEEPVKDDGMSTGDRIREDISKTLPPYMIPAFYVKVDRFPTTVSGKIDRNKLDPPERTTLQHVYTPPENETEAALCHAMEQVLGIKPLGRNDDFFLLGGDSLSVQELITVLDSDRLRAAEVVSGKTPAGIAALMEVGESLDVSDEAANREKKYPLTRYQQHYYNYCKYAGNIVLGNTPVMLGFKKGAFEAGQLAEAMKRVLTHHPAYTTRITGREEGGPMQWFVPDSISVPDVTCIGKEELEKKKRSLVQPFVLDDQPLYRCRIFSTPEMEWIFLDTHHIIADASSLDILERDLILTLKGEELPEDYYASWLNQITGMEKSAKDVILPDDTYDRYPAFDREGSGCLTQTIDVRLKGSVSSCHKKAEKRGTTLPEMLLAAGLRAIGKYNKSSKVCVNWIYSGRDMKIKQDMAGLLLSAMPVPVDLSDLPNKNKLLGKIREINQHNMKFSSLSLGHRGGQPVKDDTMTVNYIPYSSRSGENDTVIRRESLINNNTANSNVFYVIAQESAPEEGFDLRFKFNTAVYEKEKMEQFVKIYMKELALGDYDVVGEV